MRSTGKCAGNMFKIQILNKIYCRSDLLGDITSKQWPIVYRSEYNVKFMGLQKIHPFDAGKWGNIFKYLKKAELVNEETVSVPNEATKEDLLVVHTKKYLKSLKCSFNVARIAEVLPLCLVPNCLIQIGYLRPMRYQVGGSVLCGKLALERGWAINLGGGFHHCCSYKGDGFCPYADITLLIHFMFNYFPHKVKNVMIVDLDAHQGNGYARDFRDNANVYMLDIFNGGIYPFDELAKTFINRKVLLKHNTEDEEYLSQVERQLKMALNEFKPELIVYNAGTDILKGDPLGGLSVSPEGIINRDELVFHTAISKHIPIVMLTSGGYLKKTAKIIAASIVNLHNVNLIQGPKLKF